ncbi:MAG TPA: cytochrome P450, partial [Thermoanaerobaculia bacterium]|nr:cytochrome P450 [Thermoanaerobaculia bacterium]
MTQENLPGPRGGLRAGAGGRLAAFLEATRVHGDVVCLNEERRVFLISHPDHVKHVLQDHQANYRQNFRKKVLMGQQSLTLASGEAWKQRRRLLQPLFNQQRLAPLAPKVSAGTGRMLDRWAEPARRGEAVDVSQHFADLTLDLLIGDLLGSAGGRGTLRRSVTTAFDYFNERVRNPDQLPLWVPTRRNLGMARALRGLAGDVRRTIAEHRESAEPEGDLLSAMLSTRDEKTGQALNPEQIQDEIMMLLVMGHMTSAMAVTWTFFLLSRHPDAEERVRAEVADVVGDRPAGYQDVAKLVYTRMVIEESLRLYPPSWTFTRVALEDDAIGGYRIPAGSTVTLAPWVTHRRPELWPDPERFDPSRFETGRAERHRFAYYPFGGGPRVCIARDMAMMELPLILATVLQRYRLRPAAGRSAAPVPGIVLRPRAGLWMKLEDAAAPSRETAAPPELIPALLLGKPADAPAFLRRAEAGRYTPIPRDEFLDRARRAASGLAGMG